MSLAEHERSVLHARVDAEDHPLSSQDLTWCLAFSRLTGATLDRVCRALVAAKADMATVKES